MTANVITYRGRSAARDVGQGAGIRSGNACAACELAPRWGYQDEKDTAERQFREAGIDLAQPRVQKFLDAL